MVDTSGARALADALARRDAADLARVLAARGVAPGVAWRDCFDAAEELLDAASVDRALATLPRRLLRWLGDVASGARACDAPAPDALVRLGLTDADGHLLQGVLTRVLAVRRDRPAAFADGPADMPAVPADTEHAAAAAQRAAAAVDALADLVSVCSEQPLHTTAAGRVSAADSRRVVDAGLAADATDLADLLALGAAASLVVHVGREWLPGGAADEWMAQSVATRWAQVSAAWRDTLPQAVRTPAGGFTPIARWVATLPLNADWPHRVGVLRRRARRWGILAADDTEPVWSAPLRHGEGPDIAILRAALPAEIDRIYLQADLTAISPGTLRADLDLRLRAMATRESHAQASTYRFTARSLSAALTAGETATSIGAFLRDVSLTGIPQPLDYLIAQTAARHGLVQVAAADHGARVSSADPQLLRTLAVDRSLRALRLVPDGGDLLSHAGRDAAYWALVDAHYPATAVDAHGVIEPLHRRRPAASPAPEPDPADALVPLATRLLSASGGDTDAAWLARELGRAVHARQDLVVTVRMPDGAERDFALEPTGLGGGRLRGRERGADVERTVPVRSIVRVRTP